MNPYDNHPTARLRLPVRILLVLMSAGMIAVLATAVWLKPAGQGFGTHTQIPGLKPCSMRQLFNNKFGCPSCGMTTSFAHFVRGQWLQSMQSNSGGTLLALLTTLAAPWLLVSGVIGRWWIRGPNEWHAVIIASAIVVVTLTDWGIRICMAYW